MDKCKYVKKALIVLIFLTVCFLGIKQYFFKMKNNNSIKKGTIVLRLAETRTAGYPSTEAVMKFAKLVEERSKGRIRIIVYNSGKLGDEKSVIEQVQFGGIDFARVDMASMDEYSRDIKLFMLPYIIKDSQHMWKVMDSQIGANIMKSIFKEHYKCMCLYEPSARCFYNCRYGIKSLNDLRGLKISIQKSKPIMEIMAKVGSVPVFVEPNNIYSSIEEGLIDGAENNIIAYYKSKNYEIAKFVTIDNHFRIPEMIIASRVTMEGLSKEDQILIEQAAKDSVKFQKSLLRKKEEESIKGILKNGVQLVNMEEKTKGNFIKVNQSYYQAFDKDKLGYILDRIK